jgi:hypothetical protein
LKPKSTPLDDLKRSIQIEACIKIIKTTEVKEVRDWAFEILNSVVSEDEVADIKRREGF